VQQHSRHSARQACPALPCPALPCLCPIPQVDALHGALRWLLTQLAPPPGGALRRPEPPKADAPHAGVHQAPDSRLPAPGPNVCCCPVAPCLAADQPPLQTPSCSQGCCCEAGWKLGACCGWVQRLTASARSAAAHEPSRPCGGCGTAACPINHDQARMVVCPAVPPGSTDRAILDQDNISSMSAAVASSYGAAGLSTRVAVTPSAAPGSVAQGSAVAVPSAASGVDSSGTAAMSTPCSSHAAAGQHGGGSDGEGAPGATLVPRVLLLLAHKHRSTEVDAALLRALLSLRLTPLGLTLQHGLHVPPAAAPGVAATSAEQQLRDAAVHHRESPEGCQAECFTGEGWWDTAVLAVEGACSLSCWWFY
jgi:hypothetical protein